MHKPISTHSIFYLEFEDVVGLYADIFDITDRQAEDHLRDHERLISALDRPMQYAHYQSATIDLQAAVLAHGIAETQPFVDGNKRVAAIALVTFLRYNELDLNCAKRQLAEWILGLSAGGDVQLLASRVRKFLVNRPLVSKKES